MINVPPEISVIIPTWNRKEHLRKAVESVLNQETERTFEIIIVDDCSTDGTENLLSEAQFPENVKYFRQPVNQGGGAARNRGFKMALGKYIAFQDSDVLWFPEKLEAQSKLLDSLGPEVGVVYTKLLKEDGVNTGRFNVEPKRTPQGKVLESIIFDNFIDTPTSLIRRDVLEAVGAFDPRLPRFQDWEMFIRISERYEVRCVEKPMIKSFSLSNSISSNDSARLQALKIIFNEHSRLIKKYPAAHRRFSLKIANAGLLVGEKGMVRAMINERRNGLTLADRLVLVGLTFLPKRTSQFINFVRKWASRIRLS